MSAQSSRHYITSARALLTWLSHGWIIERLQRCTGILNLASLSNPSSTNLPSFSHATYNSIEGCFRVIRKEAAVMKAEVKPGACPAASPRNAALPRNANAAGSKSGPTTPKRLKTSTKKNLIGSRRQIRMRQLILGWCSRPEILA